MNILKELKWTSILLSLLFIVLGILLLLKPTTSALSITRGLAYVAIAYGLFSIIRYFTNEASLAYLRNDLLLGIMSIVFGGLLLWQTPLFVSFVPLMMGIVILFGGFRKLQDGINAKRLGANNALWYIVLAFANIMIGVVILWNPFSTAVILFMAIGLGFIYTGISDLITTIYLSSQLKRSL